MSPQAELKKKRPKRRIRNPAETQTKQAQKERVLKATPKIIKQQPKIKLPKEIENLPVPKDAANIEYKLPEIPVPKVEIKQFKFIDTTPKQVTSGNTKKTDQPKIKLPKEIEDIPTAKEIPKIEPPEIPQINIKPIKFVDTSKQVNAPSIEIGPINTGGGKRIFSKEEEEVLSKEPKIKIEPQKKLPVVKREKKVTIEDTKDVKIPEEIKNLPELPSKIPEVKVKPELPKANIKPPKFIDTNKMAIESAKGIEEADKRFLEESRKVNKIISEAVKKQIEEKMPKYMRKRSKDNK